MTVAMLPVVRFSKKQKFTVFSPFEHHYHRLHKIYSVDAVGQKKVPVSVSCLVCQGQLFDFILSFWLDKDKKKSKAVYVHDNQLQMPI